MGEHERHDAEASPPLPDPVRTELVEAFARALLRDLRAAGVLAHNCSPETENPSQNVNVEQR